MKGYLPMLGVGTALIAAVVLTLLGTSAALAVAAGVFVGVILLSPRQTMDITTQCLAHLFYVTGETFRITSETLEEVSDYIAGREPAQIKSRCAYRDVGSQGQQRGVSINVWGFTMPDVEQDQVLAEALSRVHIELECPRDADPDGDVTTVPHQAAITHRMSPENVQLAS